MKKIILALLIILCFLTIGCSSEIKQWNLTPDFFKPDHNGNLYVLVNPSENGTRYILYKSDFLFPLQRIRIYRTIKNKFNLIIEQNRIKEKTLIISNDKKGIKIELIFRKEVKQ